MGDLAARGYLDDAAFARHWVEARAARGYGPARLRAELEARGVRRPLVEAALAALAPEVALDRARAVAQRRLAVLRRGRPDRVAARLADYLLRRGYDRGVVARVVRDCTGSEERDGVDRFVHR